jgi:CubicO group peptidase (beta-lactamase class C family)
MTLKQLRLLVAALVLVVLPRTVSAQSMVQPESVGLSSERLERINDLVQQFMDSGQITGAVTLVARNGQIAHLEAQGVMDKDSRQAMVPDTMFRIASMSKPVAGVAIMMLVEEGKIRLTDPISRFLPSFEDQQVAVAQPTGGRGGRGGPPAAGGRGAAPQFYTVPVERAITIKDVLTHTSGVMSGQMSNSVGNQLSRQRHDAGLAWVDELGSTPLEFQPGSRWSYSALAGFDVLSRIVEIASGQSFDQFLESRIFEPLGIEDMTFWPSDEQRERLVSSYNYANGDLQVRNNPDSMSGEEYFSGAGGIMTTAEDYARFGMMLANNGAGPDRPLLGSRTVEVMRSVFIPNTLPGRGPGEGYGLSVRVLDDPIAAGSLLSPGTFGWSGAYGTHFFVDPVEDIVGVMMIQTPIRDMRPLFETAVMQAIID